jgi:hypothetical protein
MQDNQIISALAEVLTEKPRYQFKIPIREPKIQAPYIAPNRSFWDKITRKPIANVPDPEPIEYVRNFVVYPPVVNNMYRIAGRSANLPVEVLKGKVAEIVLPLILTYKDDIVYIIAAGIQNTKREPDRELIEFIEDNFDGEDLFNCLQAVLGGEWMQHFFNSIALAKGTIKILDPNASPQDGSELIASHTAA